MHPRPSRGGHTSSIEKVFDLYMKLQMPEHYVQNSHVLPGDLPKATMTEHEKYGVDEMRKHARRTDFFRADYGVSAERQMLMHMVFYGYLCKITDRNHAGLPEEWRGRLPEEGRNDVPDPTDQLHQVGRHRGR